MARTFNGRMSEESYNSELYKLYEILQHALDIPADPSIGPETTREGAFWLDRQNGGDLKFFNEGAWKLMFQDRFRQIGELLNSTQPDNPVNGQLWLNDGVLMYYTGSEWQPVKSVNVDSEFNLSSFEQFLIINPMEASGSPVIKYVDTDGDGTEETAVHYSQFLMPSVDMDRFFINGQFTNDYDRVSNVAIQYPTDNLSGKVASAVHVNPAKLASITKKLVIVDKTSPVIPVAEYNTEYYGFKGGAGHLLLKTADSSTEYYSVAEGVRLSPVAALMYDFVLCVTYQFKDAKQEGSLAKGKIRLNGQNSIYIGQLADPICVFVQGLYLDEDSANYTYDSTNGFLNISLESKMDVGVIATPQKEIGTITQLDGSGRGIITMTKTYNKPLVFVYGEALDKSLADFTQGVAANANKLYVYDAQIGMRYAIIESDGDAADAQMFVKSGITTTTSIPCDFTEIPGDIKPIVFVNGLLVTQGDITRNTDGSITTYGMQAGMQYVLLKDPASRLVFNDTASFATTATGSMDEALVYVESHLICDSKAVYVTKLPSTGVPGEARLLISNGTEDWYTYSKTTGWTIVTDATLISLLNQTALGYSTGRNTISILQNLGNVDAVYYAYSFGNSIEQPLLRGVIETNETDTTYKVAFNHTFPPGVNALSVWLDGIRQYPNTNSDASLPNGVAEVGSSQIQLAEPIAGNLFYVIERPEKAETRSCQREVLTIDNRVAGTSSIYQTTIPMYPGNLRVFIGGLRQPPEAYKVIDAYTIMIKDPIIGSMDNYPVETVEIDGEIVNVNHTVYDKILIEVRQDYNLREITLPVRYAGQNEWTTAAVNATDARSGGDGLPSSILDSKDFVMIYINGMAYGKEYTINQDRQSIVLTNEDVTSCLGVDYLGQYFAQNPDKYLDWQKRHDYAEYEAKPITDKITFEWR